MSGNYKDLDLDSLIKLSEAGANQIKMEMKKFDLVFDGVLKNAPAEDIDKLEKVRILSNKAIALAKDGKTEEANKVIEELKNIRK